MEKINRRKGFSTLKCIPGIIALLLSIMGTLSTSLLMAQQKYTLNGYLKDASNGEGLIGVNVLVENTQTGTVTNPYGFYSLTLAEGTYKIQYSYIGYNTQVIPVTLTKNISLDVQLEAQVSELEEIVVGAERADANITDLQMSKTRINLEQLRKLPTAFGEVYIIKSIQTQPGVISDSEGTSSSFVRGGSSNQNLILIDETAQR